MAIVQSIIPEYVSLNQFYQDQKQIPYQDRFHWKILITFHSTTENHFVLLSELSLCSPRPRVRKVKCFRGPKVEICPWDYRQYLLVGPDFPYSPRWHVFNYEALRDCKSPLREEDLSELKIDKYVDHLVYSKDNIYLLCRNVSNEKNIIPVSSNESNEWVHGINPRILGPNEYIFDLPNKNATVYHHNGQETYFKFLSNIIQNELITILVRNFVVPYFLLYKHGHYYIYVVHRDISHRTFRWEWKTEYFTEYHNWYLLNSGFIVCYCQMNNTISLYEPNFETKSLDLKVRWHLKYALSRLRGYKSSLESIGTHYLAMLYTHQDGHCLGLFNLQNGKIYETHLNSQNALIPYHHTYIYDTKYLLFQILKLCPEELILTIADYL